MSRTKSREWHTKAKAPMCCAHGVLKFSNTKKKKRLRHQNVNITLPVRKVTKTPLISMGVINTAQSL